MSQGVKRQPNPAHAAETAADPLDDSALRSLVGYQLRRADLFFQQMFAREIGDAFGLRQVEFSILVLLATNQPVRHKQISRALGVAPSNMVGVMSGLEKRRLIVRRDDPSDGRSSLWQLTEEGRQCQQRAHAAVTAMEQQVMADSVKLSARLDALWSSEASAG